MGNVDIFVKIDMFVKIDIFVKFDIFVKIDILVKFYIFVKIDIFVNCFWYFHQPLIFMSIIEIFINFWLKHQLVVPVNCNFAPHSTNYFDFPQIYSLRTQKLPNLLCSILSGRAIALKMCQSVVKKRHKCLMNMS